MKPEPNPAVRAWLNNQAAETLFLSSVTLAELLFGIGYCRLASARKC
jgi:predicted nucleic acid-binding protein